MKKGDIWMIDLPDKKGHEQRGQRPAIVINKCVNGLCPIIPLTTKTERLNFSLTHLIEPSKENGLSEHSIALVFQLTAADKNKFKKKIGRLTKEETRVIDELLKELLFKIEDN